MKRDALPTIICAHGTDGSVFICIFSLSPAGFGGFNSCGATHDSKEIFLFNYTLRGETGYIIISINESMLLHMQNRDWLLEIDELLYSDLAGEIYTDEIVRQIQKKTNDRDDQARIAISLVQHIPYDEDAPNCPSTVAEVMANQKGDCDEKSALLAKLLQKLGYGTSYFCFMPERHMNVGVKCPDQYAFLGTGYAIVESTTPNIITDWDFNRFPSKPIMIPLSEGDSMGSVGEEYMDAFMWNAALEDISAGNNGSIGVALCIKEKYIGI